MILEFLGLSLDEEESKVASPASESSAQASKQLLLDKVKRRKRDEKKKEAWNIYWHPILVVLSDLCRDGRADVRNNGTNPHINFWVFINFVQP